MFGFEGKVVLVTGGASNIGRAICKEFSSHGASVIVADLAEADAKKVSADLPNSTALKVDVTKDDSVQQLSATIKEKYGHLDVIVLSAGWVKDILFLDQPLEEVKKILEINLMGVILCMRHLLPLLFKTQGSVVFLASEAGRIGEYQEAVYSAAKAGVIALTKALSREYGKQGVRFNSVAPGVVIPESAGSVSSGSLWTPEMLAKFNPEALEKMKKANILRRLGTATDIAKAVCFLASPTQSRFITGQTLGVSGGYAML